MLATTALVGPFASSGNKRARTDLGWYDGCDCTFTREEMKIHPDWKLISANDITMALLLYDTDNVVQGAINMKLNHVLGGGIIFKRRFHKMTDSGARWHSQTYSSILRQIYRYLHSIGFAAQTFKPHADYIGEPVLLDLTRLETYVLVDLFGEPHYKFFQATANTLVSANDSSDEIEGVNVINFKSPDSNGKIRSICTALKSDYDIENALQEFMFVACKMKCFPPLITELHTQKADNTDIYSSYSIGADATGGVNTDAHDSNARMAHNRSARQMLREYNGVSKRVASSGIAQGTHNAMYNNQVMLDPDRKVAKGDHPEEPNNYMEFSTKRRDEVFAYFSIPPGVIAAGAGSSASKSTTSSVNSMVIFVNDQKLWKSKFLAMVQDMYCTVNSKASILESIVDGVKKKQRKDDESVKSECDTEVEMPGIPEDDTIMKLYVMGVMSYDAFCAIMRAKYGFSKSAFNPTPGITVEMLNGIKPEAPKSQTGSK